MKINWLVTPLAGAERFRGIAPLGESTLRAPR